MEATLKNLYLRLDGATQSLTRNAEMQMIMKIGYSLDREFSIEDICKEYRKLVGSQNITNEYITPLLEVLEQANEIKPTKNGKYNLTNAQKRKILKAKEDAEYRDNRIIEKYFQRCSTDRENIKLWLSDITQAFFNCFSEEWISDINFHKGAIEHSRESIKTLIVNRTKTSKNLEKIDKEHLPDCYYNFITSSDGDVNDYLWEYGTSAFAAKLLVSDLGADALAIESIKDSCCYLDTNILMNLGLERSEYAAAFKALEKIFESLNVSVKYLYVTKKEYECAVGDRISKILNNVAHYKFEVIKEDSNQYIQTALARQCVNYDDFVRFFEPLRNVPQYLNETLPVTLCDNNELAEIVDKASNNQERINKMQEIFHSFTDREKRWSPLIHDVAFTAGVEFLRNNEKCFILSQDYLINKYSQENVAPAYGLPLSIKLDTLISMLAIYNGGVDTFDYKPLFSLIISHGYCPKKDLFTTTDLYKMREIDEKISQLDSCDVVEIAKRFHNERIDGKTEKELALTLSREIGMAEIHAIKELKNAQDDLMLERTEKERHKKNEKTALAALMKTCFKDAEKEYNKKAILTIGSFLCCIIVLFVVIKFNFIPSTWYSWGGGIVVSIATTIIVNSFTKFFSIIRKSKKVVIRIIAKYSIMENQLLLKRF